jgi:hypothetical protein
LTDKTVWISNSEFPEYQFGHSHSPCLLHSSGLSCLVWVWGSNIITVITMLKLTYTWEPLAWMAYYQFVLCFNHICVLRCISLYHVHFNRTIPHETAQYLIFVYSLNYRTNKDNANDSRFQVVFSEYMSYSHVIHILLNVYRLNSLHLYHI